MDRKKRETGPETGKVDLDLVGTIGPKPRADYGIAIVGASKVARYAHLPVYRDWSLRVVGITDLDQEQAKAVAKEFQVPKVYPDLSALLSDDSVQIVDIAVPAEFQPEIACQALEAGRHLLCQKPFAVRYGDARKVVELAEARGLKVAVNQQMRWTPSMRAVKELMHRGWPGEPLRTEFEINLWEGLGGWVLEVDPFDVLYYSIHFYDVSRFLYEEPEWVYSICGKWPGQALKGETRTNTLLEYPSGLQLLHRTNHNNHAGDTYARPVSRGGERRRGQRKLRHPLRVSARPHRRVLFYHQAVPALLLAGCPIPGQVDAGRLCRADVVPDGSCRHGLGAGHLGAGQSQ